MKGHSLRLLWFVEDFKNVENATNNKAFGIKKITFFKTSLAFEGNIPALKNQWHPDITKVFDIILTKNVSKGVEHFFSHLFNNI